MHRILIKFFCIYLMTFLWPIFGYTRFSMDNNEIIEGTILRELPHAYEIKPRGDKPFLVIQKSKVLKITELPEKELITVDTNLLSNPENRKPSGFFKAGFGYDYGDHVYQIGGLVTLPDGTNGNLRFPISELNYEINTPYIWLGGDIPFNERLHLNLKARKNLLPQNSLMKDSDWGVNYYTNKTGSVDTLDIYSESDTTFDFFGVYAGVKTSQIVPGFSFWYGLGADFEYLSITVRDAYQTSTIAQYNIGQTYGQGILYNAAIIQYLQGSAGIYFDSRIISISAGLEFSPAIVFNEDDHLFRKMKSTGFTSGFEASANIDMIFHIGEKFNVSIKPAINYLITNGRLTEERYENTEEGVAGRVAMIDLKLTSLRYNILVSAAFRI